MTEYTPTTDEMRNVYASVQALGIRSGPPGAIEYNHGKAKFDRWLNEIRAEAWDEAISSVFERAESFRGESSLETFLLKHGGRSAAIQAENPYRPNEK